MQTKIKVVLTGFNSINTLHDNLLTSKIQRSQVRLIQRMETRPTR